MDTAAAAKREGEREGERKGSERSKERERGRRDEEKEHVGSASRGVRDGLMILIRHLLK